VRKLTQVDFPPWTLPLLAIAIAVPVIAAFALGGPAAGMAAGALVAAAIVVIAARTRFEEEIEVASAPTGGGVLVVTTARIEGAGAVDAVRDARARAGATADVLVLAPALNRPVSHWLSDLRQARLEAQERLAVSIGVLATAGIDARGQVGDTDPVQAIEDVLRSFSAAEVVFVTDAGSGEEALGELRRRLDRPVTHAIGDDPGAGARTPEASRS
jgi:hypothetical protein